MKLLSRGSPIYQAASRLPSGNRHVGFTLVEVLASAIIILVASVGAIVAFNLITQSVRGTGLRADQSRRIDSQIAEISRVAEVYTACSTPQGAVPADPITVASACPGAVGSGNTAIRQVGDSFYYFPDPANATNVNLFFAACRSSVSGNHITANFVNRINNNTLFPPPGGSVTRSSANRVNATDPASHLVEIAWVDSANPTRVLRIFRIAPLLSAWCP